MYAQVTCEDFIPFVARAVESLFDSTRRLIATEELTNKLVDFYGPSPQNLTKLLLEENKLLQENNTNNAGSAPSNEQANNTNAESTIHSDAVPSNGENQSAHEATDEQKQVDQATAEETAELTTDIAPNPLTMEQQDALSGNSESSQTNQTSENSTAQNTSDQIWSGQR